MALPNHLVYDLLEAAEHLARQPGRPNLTKTFRRRAISSAYYAVFQAVCFIFTDAVLGWGSEPELVEPVFRSVDHATARKKLAASADDSLSQLGVLLALLQAKRHDADYLPPKHNPSQAEALEVVEQARVAIAMVENLDRRQRRLVAVALIG